MDTASKCNLMSGTTLDLEIPFKTARIAKVAYDVLRVDVEPKRGSIKKEIKLKDRILHISFEAESLKYLRVSVDCLFENIYLLGETIELLGDPVSDSFNHYNQDA